MKARAGRRPLQSARGIITSVLLALMTSASACINEYSTLLSGEVFMGEGTHCPLAAHLISAVELALKLDSLDGLGHVRQASNEELSDRGAALVYLGRYAEALRQFRELQSHGFDPYTVCANMGTTFELMGQNDSALYYIRKAVELNPEAHKGSEWIHVRILERKVALERGEPVTSPMLGIDFGSEELPSALERDELADIRNQLRYQLQERMTFVKPKDAIVGELLFELGNMEAVLWGVECAVDVYDVAKEYGYTSELFDRRYAKLSGMTGKATILNAIHPATDQDANWITYLFYGALLALPVLFIWALWRLFRRPRAR